MVLTRQLISKPKALSAWRTVFCNPTVGGILVDGRQKTPQPKHCQFLSSHHEHHFYLRRFSTPKVITVTTRLVLIVVAVIVVLFAFLVYFAAQKVTAHWFNINPPLSPKLSKNNNALPTPSVCSCGKKTSASYKKKSPCCAPTLGY